MLLAESAQLLVDEVLAADGLLVANTSVLHVTAEGRLSVIPQQAAGALAGARFLLFIARCASAAGDSSASLADFEDVAHAEF